MIIDNLTVRRVEDEKSAWGRNLNIYNLMTAFAALLIDYFMLNKSTKFILISFQRLTIHCSFFHDILS